MKLRKYLYEMAANPAKYNGNAVWQVVKQCIKAEVNPSTGESMTGLTPLIALAERGHTEGVKELIARGAKVGYCRRDGHNALTIAAQNGHNELVDLMIDKLSNKERKAIIVKAVETGSVSLVEKLLDRRVDIESKDPLGNTLVAIAAKRMDARMVNMLSKKNANLSVDIHFPNGKKESIFSHILKNDKPVVDRAKQVKAGTTFDEFHIAYSDKQQKIQEKKDKPSIFAPFTPSFLSSHNKGRNSH
jgi:ankyrin repeat protein